jgi:uncharacterized protein (DUF2235 family)
MTSTSKGRAGAPGSGLPRNIALFIDGTWNEAGTRKSTNVRKLFAATPEGLQAGREQFTFYISGVGTRPKIEARGNVDADYQVELARYLRPEMPGYSTQDSRKLMGGVAGWGTAGRIKLTYHRLCELYSRERGDRVFMFGFSRGAFAARSLAGFVGKVGLLLADQLAHVERAYEIYERSEDPAQTELADFLEKLTGVRVVHGESEFYLPMHFLGVWDTVASLGLPSRLEWLTAPFTEYHQVEVPSSVVTARHALALHELRGSFEPLLWKPGAHRDLQQVWFSGAHADVGGGYVVGEDGLSDIALRWMAGEARTCGLVVADAPTWWTAWNEQPPVHHEFRGVFLATWPAPRSWLLDHSDECEKSHHFHRSAIDYLQEADQIRYGFKLPYVNAALRKTDALALPMAVRLLLMGQGVLE